ncbi:hypothetical protein [Massilia putida]|uniref:hypothetical protein n=1 Tax=Massilia putida TaxID=1141883 RepID=UPI0012EC57C9|nr:hypothetical protein [Massilia putida]
MKATAFVLRTMRRTVLYGWNVVAPALGIPRPLFAISAFLLLYWMANYAYVALTA